jgi:hypothetical protein
MRAHFLCVILFATTVAACSPVQDRSSVAIPAPGQQATVGVGDIVFELRKRESLPDEFGTADVFGRTRDTGRVTLRYTGVQDGRAYFTRNDVNIDTNETTLSQMPTYVPAVQNSTMTGSISKQPFQSNTTTTGMMVIPPRPISRTVTRSGDVSLSAPIGGTLMIAGHRVNVIAADESAITYTAN